MESNDPMEENLLPPLPCPETFRKRGSTILQSHHVCNHPKTERRPSSGFGGKLSASLDNLLDIRRSKRRINKKIYNSNFFTLLIQLSDQEEVIEKVNFSLSQSFRSTISSALQRYKLDPADVDLRLDGSEYPLPLHTDINILVGSLIHVKYRDGESPGRGRKSEKRNSTSGIITPRNGALSPALKPPSKPRRASFSLTLFPSRPSEVDSIEDKLDRLNMMLSSFSSGNIPELPAYMDDILLNYDVNLSKLESSWQSIVKDYENLSIRQQKQQSAIWELLDTEVNFINQLRNLITIHLATFHSLHSDFFVDIDPTKLFSNLHEVYCANCVFWFEYLSKTLIHSRETGEPLKIFLLKTSFEKINELLKPYSRFCTEVNDCRQNLQRLERENILLKTFLQWASDRDSSNRENFCDLLMKPFQRLCKYKPVLESIKKNTTEDQDLVNLSEMIANVDGLVQQVNNAKHRSELLSELESIDNRIESYEAVDPLGDEWQKHLMQYTKFSLHKTAQLREDVIREVIYEGVLKMKEGPKSIVEVTCFLFTDLLLITKSSNKKSDKLKIFKPPIRLDKLIILSSGPPGHFACVVLNDFLCVNFVYLFTGKSEDIENWVSKLKKVKIDFITDPNLYTTKPLTIFDVDENVDIPKVEIESISLFNRTLSDQVRTHTRPPDRAATFPLECNDSDELSTGQLRNNRDSLTSLTARSPLTIRRKSKEFTSPLVHDYDDETVQTAPPSVHKPIPMFMYTSPNSSSLAISSYGQDCHSNNEESSPTADTANKLLSPNNGSELEKDRRSRSLCDLTFIDGETDDSTATISTKIKLVSKREATVKSLTEDKASSQLCV